MPFDEDSKLPKLRAVIPREVCNYIAIEARNCTRYDELVQFIEAQTMDPITAVKRGDEVPGLSNLQGDEQPGWHMETVTGMLKTWRR